MIIFGYRVRDPERYGVVEFNSESQVVSIAEKPENPKSNYAVTGMYMFDNDVCQIAKELVVSSRGELEIVDVINQYLKQGRLRIEKLGRGIAWLDTGTHKSLLAASNFIEVLENRQGLKIACIEEIAHQKGWISDDELISIANSLMKNSYGQYLMSCIDHD